MIRAFTTHKIRRTEELSSCLWDFRTLSASGDAPSGPVPSPIKAAVPGCWEAYPETANYRGRAVYSRKFVTDTEANIRLVFKGVSHTAEIMVDGQRVCGHYNAYTPFDAVLPCLKPGEHTLDVIADNSFSSASALHVPNDYQSYGGISRGVMLELLEDVYICRIHFTPVCKSVQTNQWSGKVQVCLVNLSEKPFEGDIELHIEGQPHKILPVEIGPKETSVLSCDDLPCRNVCPWSPETPVLYYLNAVLRDKASMREVDDLTERIGFREVRIEGRDILLNGKKLLIKGFCRHEDHPQFGCAIPFSAMQYDLTLIKDLGGNSVRTSHYPNDELFLDLCDEQGILVWEENHARGLSDEQMSNPNFEKQCEDCIREMVDAHYNHPSIYIWGILNECASHTELGRMCYKSQYELIRSMDRSRPVSSASCQFKTDICLDLPDVVSYNIYPKWYNDTPAAQYLAELYDWVQSSTDGRGKPFLITETGAGAVYGYRTPSRVKWSEEYQAQALEEQIRAVLAHKGCSGIYIWQFCDTRVCDDWFDKRPKTMNNKGIVDEYRRPKLAYEKVKELFRKLPQERTDV